MIKKILAVVLFFVCAWLLRDFGGRHKVAFRIVNAGTIAECEKGDGYACWWLGLLKKRNGDRSSEIHYYRLACDKGYGPGCARLSGFAEAEGNTLLARDLARRACAKGAWEGCFNVACYLSRDEDLDGAFSYLERAMRSGLASEKNFEALIANERDFDNLRIDPRFEEITRRGP